MTFEQFSPASYGPDKNEIFKLVIESAQNGTTANTILGLDLSTREGRNKLHDILLPWDEFKGSEDLRTTRILLPNGNELFPYKTSFESVDHGRAVEFYLEYLVDALNDLMPNLESLTMTKKLTSIGHGLVKASSKLPDAFDVRAAFMKEDGYKNFDRQDPRFFAVVLANTLKITCESLNLSPTGYYLDKFSEMSGEVAEQHPNFKTLKKLLDSFNTFLPVWENSFYTYIDSLVHNKHMPLLDEGNSLFVEDLSLGRKMKSGLDLLSKSEGNVIENINKNIFLPEIEEEALFLIGKIESYKQTLKKYNSRPA